MDAYRLEGQLPEQCCGGINGFNLQLEKFLVKCWSLWVTLQNTVWRLHQVCPGKSLNVCVNQSRGPLHLPFFPFSYCDFTLNLSCLRHESVLIGGAQILSFSTLIKSGRRDGRERQKPATALVITLPSLRSTVTFVALSQPSLLPLSTTTHVFVTISD